MVKTKKIKKIKITKKNNEIKQNDGTILLKGTKALLLAEACKLNKTKKDAEKRIKKIKAEIDLNKTGEYKNEADDRLVLSESDKFSDVDARKLYLKFKRKSKAMEMKFFSIVKVQIGPLEKIMPKSIIEKLRIKLDPIQKWSFK